MTTRVTIALGPDSDFPVRVSRFVDGALAEILDLATWTPEALAIIARW